MAITDTDYLKTIAAYAESLGSTAEPDSELEVNARLDADYGTVLGDWYGDAFNFDRNGTAATATIEFTASSFPINNDQTIKITDAFGTELTYTVASSTTAADLEFAGVTSNADIATALETCINSVDATDIVAAGCHGGTISVSRDGAKLTLTQDVEGTDGNVEIDISGFTQDVVLVSNTESDGVSGINSSAKKGFRGGIGACGTTTLTVLDTIANNTTITLTSEDGGEEAGAFTEVTYTGLTTETLGDNEFKRNGATTTITAKSIHDCIINAAGHQNKLIVSQNGPVLTIKQKLAGRLGNTTIGASGSDLENDISIASAFSGGEYGFTGIGAVLPGSSLMTFTNHATNNNAVLKSAISAAFKSFCKIKK